LAAYPAGGTVTGRLRIERARPIFHGPIVLIDPEERGADIERAAEIFALDADLVILADDGLDEVVGNVAGILRLENVGVAGIDRMPLVEIENESRVFAQVVIVFIAARIARPGTRVKSLPYTQQSISPIARSCCNVLAAT
jgi:hypothetical protein